ncbi:MAG: nucleotidyltransferase domain-containing protein [Cyclobacteriaceae bacterium]
MKSAEEIEAKIRKVKPILESEYGVSSIGYFGSYAKGNVKKGSDVDVLVDFSKSIGWKFFDLKEYLEKIVGKEVV